MGLSIFSLPDRIEAYRASHRGENPPVTIRTEAWLDLAALGLEAGETYVHDGKYARPKWCPRWAFEALARFVVSRLFRKVSFLK